MTVGAGRTALVTGASSGIGAAFARVLAARNCNMILVARRRSRLATLAGGLSRSFGVRADVVVADLATGQGIDEVLQRLDEHPPLDWLVNNAGFAIPGRFAELPLERTMPMIELHVLAAVRLCRAVLPGMIARGTGRIVNVASIGAFLPRPADATYCATKAYLVSFSRALQGELDGTGVRVQALCPGFTRTEFYDQPAYATYPIKNLIPRPLWMSPDTVVEASLKAFDRRRVVFVPGIQNRLLVALAQAGLAGALIKAFDRRAARPSSTSRRGRTT